MQIDQLKLIYCDVDWQQSYRFIEICLEEKISRLWGK